MKRKICFVLVMLLLALPLTIFSVQATGGGADPGEWAVINYLCDAEEGEETGKSGTLSFATEAKNYMRRATTFTWDANVLEVRVNGAVRAAGSCNLWKAGAYTFEVKDLATGQTATTRVNMLPVIKMGGEYLVFNTSTGELVRPAFNCNPVVECENVDKIEVDGSDYVAGTPIAGFGEHRLKLISGSDVVSFRFDIYACLAEKRYDEELGKNCLVLTVGDFGEDCEVYLDGVELLTPGEHKVTAVGQHTISAKKDARSLPNASPPPQQLNLQVVLLLGSLALDEPITLQLSRWDATFYVNGKQISGNYRVTSNGKNEITAYDKDGKKIENAFYVQKVGAESGTAYTDLVLEFNNPHYVYAIILIVPAAAMGAAVVFFFLRRRRIV